MTRFISILVLAAALTACGAPEQPLVGRWQSEESGYVNQLELFADGTYAGTLQQRIATGGLESAGHYAGRWKLRGGKFSGEVIESNAPLLAVGYAWSDDLIEFNTQSMVLRSPNAHEITWQRSP